MNTTREEAFSLLSGWRNERRVVCATLTISEKISSCVVGRIERLDATSIRIDDESFSEFENRTVIEIDLLSAIEFRFDDTRIVAALEGVDEIKRNYEGFLFLLFPNGVEVNLMIAMPSE